ncbi:hypothetical protein M446_3322 [Methylobacterium sp. 4-46]|uniref:hypothetical protein n=1 Tax=unclassified Methylobacterium TaxID=2615210 RepID=UPI000165C6AC|nr:MULTISPECIES: hypothetical protein [Methylobacterium]ACA17725.1 hypothetical protein M446_3322 [Methylobacterium sp. 4-46]WFT83395.1 hypothetical protein QA634_16845 [Methylobacterium nodulans]
MTHTSASTGCGASLAPWEGLWTAQQDHCATAKAGVATPDIAAIRITSTEVQGHDMRCRVASKRPQGDEVAVTMQCASGADRWNRTARWQVGASGTMLVQTEDGQKMFFYRCR